MKCYYDGVYLFSPAEIVSVTFVRHMQPFIDWDGSTKETMVIRVFKKDQSFVTIPVATIEAGNKKMEEIKGLMEQE